MSDKELTKAAFEQAEKEARERKVAEVKAIVTETLEKLETVRKQIHDLQEEERILKLDIDDLKNGKLDLIAERQAKDPRAKGVSVVLIVREKEVVREVPVYYWPYHIYWQLPVPTYHTPEVWCGTSAGNVLNNAFLTADSTQSNFTNVIDCSVARDAVAGTYNISGHVVHLR